MNVLKIFRRRSQSAPMKPSKDVTTPPTPLKNLLLLIDCDKEDVDNVLGRFKGLFLFLHSLFKRIPHDCLLCSLDPTSAYFGDENLIKATSDGTVFYVGIQDKHKDTFIKKVEFLKLFVNFHFCGVGLTRRSLSR